MGTASPSINPCFIPEDPESIPLRRLLLLEPMSVLLRALTTSLCFSFLVFFSICSLKFWRNFLFFFMGFCLLGMNLCSILRLLFWGMQDYRERVLQAGLEEPTEDSDTPVRIHEVGFVFVDWYDCWRGWILP